MWAKIYLKSLNNYSVPHEIISHWKMSVNSFEFDLLNMNHRTILFHSEWNGQLWVSLLSSISMATSVKLFLFAISEWIVTFNKCEKYILFKWTHRTFPFHGVVFYYWSKLDIRFRILIFCFSKSDWDRLLFSNTEMAVRKYFEVLWLLRGIHCKK